MKKKLAVASGIIACVTVLMFAGVIVFRNIPQNAASWLMWTLLDAVLFGSMSSAGSKNAWLVLGYFVSALAVTAVLILKGAWTWGTVETASAIGVIVSAIVWQGVGAQAGVIAGTVANAMAGVPATYTAWIHPAPASWWMWALCAFAGFLAVLGAKDWSIKERLYPMGSFLFNLMMFILVIR